MEKWLQRIGVLTVAAVLTAMVWPLTETQKVIEASPIKNWTSNERVSYTDLNNNFNHLHANLGHGHGPIITAADIAPNAGIRPEQTTFGAAVNRALVFEGTFKAPTDGGTLYNSINGSGTLGVSVVRNNISTGFDVLATGSGVLADGGTNVYTVFALGRGSDTVSSSPICFNTKRPDTGALGTSIFDSYTCYEVSSWNGVPVETYPVGVSVQVYYNGVAQ